MPAMISCQLETSQQPDLIIKLISSSSPAVLASLTSSVRPPFLAMQLRQAERRLH